MNWIDLILSLIVILSVWAGWKKGFIVATLDLIAWVGSILIGFFFYRYPASILEEYAPSIGIWTFPVAFVVTILLARILLSFVTRSLLRAIPEEAHTNTANRFLGIIPGAVNGAINVTILAALLMALPFSDNFSANTKNSKIVNRLAYQAEWLNAKLSPIFDEAVRKSLSNLTVEPESNKTVTLDYNVHAPKTRSDLESKMLDMVNEERTKLGLKPLKADPEMSQVARGHSRDMFARGYFAHISPDGKTVGNRVKDAGISFLVVGENLALGPTISICHEGLMNSPGHKANILHKSFGRVGIGALDGGKYGLMITQNFRN